MSPENRFSRGGSRSGRASATSFCFYCAQGPCLAPTAVHCFVPRRYNRERKGAFGCTKLPDEAEQQSRHAMTAEVAVEYQKPILWLYRVPYSLPIRVQEKQTWGLALCLRSSQQSAVQQTPGTFAEGGGRIRNKRTAHATPKPQQQQKISLTLGFLKARVQPVTTLIDAILSVWCLF